MSGSSAGGATAGGEQPHRNAALVAENVQLQKEIARMRHALGVKDADNARLRADVKMQAETQQQMLKELDQMAVDWRRDVLLSRKVWNAAIAVTRKRKGRVFAGEDVHGAGAARPSSAASQNNQKHRRAAAVDIGPSAHPRERERERERESRPLHIDTSLDTENGSQHPTSAPARTLEVEPSDTIRLRPEPASLQHTFISSGGVEKM